MTELLVADTADGARILTLNRPDQRNALSPELILQLGAQVAAIAADESVTCVVLRGAGPSFCAGYDLKARERAKTLLPPNYAADTINALAALPQPVVVVAHGHCLTGGLELALAADFIVAANSTRFADTHARWSMRAAWGLTQRLPRRVGAALAKDMMFTGRELNGREALAAGLVTRCVADDALDHEVEAIVAALCERSAPVLRWIKQQVAAGGELPLAEALAHERAVRPQGTAATDAQLQAQGWAGR